MNAFFYPYSPDVAAFYERLSVPRIPLIERGYILIENHAIPYSPVWQRSMNASPLPRFRS